MICQFQIFILKKNNWIKKKLFVQLIYTFSCVNPPGRDMKKIITSIVSRPFHSDTHRFTA